MLAALGRDCAGAVAILPPGEDLGNTDADLRNHSFMHGKEDEYPERIVVPPDTSIMTAEPQRPPPARREIVGVTPGGVSQIDHGEVSTVEALASCIACCVPGCEELRALFHPRATGHRVGLPPATDRQYQVARRLRSSSVCSYAVAGVRKRKAVLTTDSPVASPTARAYAASWAGRGRFGKRSLLRAPCRSCSRQ